MRWIFENPQLLIVIGGAIAYWLNQRRKAKEDRAMEEELGRAPTDDEMAERTRRIQEEIRRKIAERQGHPVPPPVARVEPPRPAAPPPLPTPAPLQRPVVFAPEDTPGAAELERVMNQQRRYAEQLEELAAAEEARATAMRAATAAVAPLSMAAYAMPEPRALAARAAGGGLDTVLTFARDREFLRRAMVLREVLGAPKALQ